MAEQQVPTSPVTPYLCVDGAADAIEFYKRAFGAQELLRMPTEDGKRLMHAALLINGGPVFLSDYFDEAAGMQVADPRRLGGTPVTIHLNLADVDATWDQAVAAGAEIAMPLETQFWGDRYGQLRDPFGHMWSLATPAPQQAG